MAKPLHPPAPVALYGLGYILLSLQLPFDFMDELRVVLSGDLFVPMLAAWLGWRFGRRGLLPLWLSAPMTVPRWDLDIGDFSTVSLGLGPALFVLCALITLVFAARRAGTEQTAGPMSPAGMAVSAAVLVLAAGNAEVGAWIGNGSVSLRVDAPWNIAVAAFGLIALRRSSAMFVAGSVAVVTIAGYGLNLLTEAYVLAEAGNYDYSFFASAGWGIRAIEAFSFGLAAVFAGVIVRDWPGIAAAARIKGMAAAGLAVLLIAPPLLLTSELAINAALDAAPVEREIAAPGVPASPGLAAVSLLPVPVMLQAVEEIIVTASRRTSSAQTALGHPAAKHLLALFSLALGAALGRRAAFWLPQGVVLVTVISALGVEWADFGQEYFSDRYFAEDFIQMSISPLIWTAFACWTFVWLGMRARLRADGQTGGGTWTGM